MLSQLDTNISRDRWIWAWKMKQFLNKWVLTIAEINIFMFYTRVYIVEQSSKFNLLKIQAFKHSSKPAKFTSSIYTLDSTTWDWWQLLTMIMLMLFSEYRNLNIKLSDASSMQILDNQKKNNVNSRRPVAKFSSTQSKKETETRKKEYDNYINTFTSSSAKNDNYRHGYEQGLADRQLA